MTFKIISILFIFFYITNGNQCEQRINVLESKIDRILSILESTFRTADNNKHYSNNNDIYGTGNIQSGGAYSPNPIQARGTNLDLKPRIGKVDLSIKGGPSKLDDRYASGSLSASTQDQHNRGLAYVDASKELEKKGYSDADAHIGANVYNNDQSAVEGYNKDESYLTDVTDGNVYEAEYSGTRINDSISALRRNVVREEQTIEEGFYNDFQKENHEGDYNGNEFDVGFKSKETNGGFNELNAKNEIEQSRYLDKKNNGEGYNSGNDYTKERYTNEDEENDLYSRNVRYNPDSKYGDYSNPDEQALYDKYTGKKSSAPNDKKSGYGYGHGGFGMEREHKDKESDIDERLYANEFDVNDKFSKSISNEDNIGVMQKVNAEKQFNNGKYVDVEASGFNKNANYRGDYKNNKEKRNTGYTFKNLESVEEIGTPDRFASAVVIDDRVDYRGKEKKSSLNNDRKSGRYTDRERNRKDKINQNANAYISKDFVDKKEKEIEADAYFDNRKGKHVNRDEFKKGHNNGYGKYPRGNVGNGNGYGYYRPDN